MGADSSKIWFARSAVWARPDSRPFDTAIQSRGTSRLSVHFAFKSGVVLPVFDNVDVYPLLTRLIGVKGDKGDGSLGPVKAALR